MNFLTKTLSSLTGQAIPYNKGDFVARIENLWELYDGTSKNDGSPVSIFQFDKQQASSSSYAFAANCAKKLSVIKIPGVLRIIEVADLDSTLYMVTERVRPLSYCTESNKTKILGVYSIVKTLKFLNQDANSVHGKINIESVFVTPGGEWKLGGFELLTNFGDMDRNLLLQGYSLSSFKMYMDPPELTSLDILQKGKTGVKFDAFKLGCFILQVYNDNNVPASSAEMAEMLKIVPRNLQAGVKKLLSDSITTRATAELFLRKGEESFFDTQFIRNYNDLQEINFKSSAEKLELFEHLTSNTDSYPTGFVEFALLPAVIQFFMMCEQPPAAAAAPQGQAAGLEQPQDDPEATSKVLYYTLQLTKHAQLDKAKFSQLVKPIVLRCFAKSDRAVRMTLLQSLPEYIDKLEKSEVSNTIFGNLVTGFNDTNAAIREETLKSITVVAPLLSERQLNNDLLRYLAKLQNDESETIRTNVVICLSKIGQHMSKSSRANILITAFSKSIKDPFIPTRLSTLVAFATCVDYFTPEIIASRILSIIAPSLLDKSGKIRQEAAKMFALFLDIIHKEAERLPAETDVDEQEKDVKSLGNILADTTLGWGSLNRFATPPIQEEDSQIKWSHKQSSTAGLAVQSHQATPESDDEDDDELIDDTWGDDGFEEEEEEAEVKPKFQPRPVTRKPVLLNKGSNTQQKVLAKNTKSGGLKLQAKPKTSKLKLDLKLEEDDNGWGDGWN